MITADQAIVVEQRHNDRSRRFAGAGEQLEHAWIVKIQQRSQRCVRIELIQGVAVAMQGQGLAERLPCRHQRIERTLWIV